MIYYYISAILLIITRIILIKTCHEYQKQFRVGNDVVKKLHRLNKIFKTGGGFRPSYPEFMLIDKDDYPHGFEYLLYLLRIRADFLLKHGYCIPIIFDFLTLTLLYAAIQIYAAKSFHWLLFFPFLQLLYGNYARAAQFNYRAFGVFCGNAFLLAQFMFVHTNSYTWLYLSVPCFLLFAISTKFPWQATFFVSLLVSVFAKNYVYFLFFAAHLAGVMIVSLGYTWIVLKGIVRHLQFYSSSVLPMMKNKKSYYCDFIKAFDPRSFMNTKNKPVSFGLYQLLHNPLSALVWAVPLNLVLLAYMAQNTGVLYGAVWMWWFSGIVLVFLIATPWLSFMGEPERYLEFTLIPLFLLLASKVSLMQNVWLQGVYILAWGIVLLVFCLTIREGLSRAKTIKEDPTLDQGLLGYFSEVKGKRVLTIPTSVSFLLAYHNDQNSFLTHLSCVGAGENRKKLSRLWQDCFLMPGCDLKGYVREYHLDLIVVDFAKAKWIKKFMGREVYYAFEGWPIVFENEKYKIYNVS